MTTTNRLSLTVNFICIAVCLVLLTVLLDMQSDLLDLQVKNDIQSQKLADRKGFITYVTNRLDKGWSFKDEVRYAEENGFPMPKPPVKSMRPPQAWDREYTLPDGTTVD